MPTSWPSPRPIPAIPPSLSIVIPCYNASDTIARAVDSVRAQSLTDWELIIVDDGSTDGTADIVATLAANDSRIQLERRPHLGVSSAANHGMSIASAPLIARMDSDDTSRPDRMAKQLDFLTKNPTIDIVSCLVNFAGDPKTAGGYAYHVEWANRFVNHDQILLNRFVDLPMPNPTLMLRRDLLKKHGDFRHGDFPEDYELFLRWISEGVRVGKIDKILYDWHDPPTRLTRNDTRYDKAAFHRCKATYLTKAIINSGCANRDLWIWGAGRPARKYANSLETTWKPASGFIDIDPRKIGHSLNGRPIVSTTDLPSTENSVIVSYVGTRGARDVIRSELLSTGRTEGTDFWLAC